MTSVVSLNASRPSVTFSVEITQHSDDSLDVVLCDIADDPRNIEAALHQMKRAVTYIEGLLTDG